MKSLVFAAACFWLGASALSAQTFPRRDSLPASGLGQDVPRATWLDDRTVLLEINALSNQQASSYVAVFHVRQTGETAEEADRLFNERYKLFLADLLRLGLAANDLHVDLIGFAPIYESEPDQKKYSKTFNEIPKGFEIQKNIHIRYADKNLLSRLVALAARTEIYDLMRVDYIVQRPDTIYRHLRHQALEYAKSEIHAFEELGVELDAGFRIVSETETAIYPHERYTQQNAHAHAVIDAKKGKVPEPKKHDPQPAAPQAVFYEPLSYRDFEIVLNPEILEPAVQFVYTLKVRFELAKPTDKTKKQHFWLTPDGKVQPVPVD